LLQCLYKSNQKNLKTTRRTKLNTKIKGDSCEKPIKYPSTIKTKAAKQKAKFLKQIIDGIYQIDKISVDKAFELLSHMKGGPSIKVLIDLALSPEAVNSKKSSGSA
jgi:hypothetical protein